MSDTRLRELERRWKETGSAEDEAAYLLERVRVGDLTQERLELAAYCGHEGAKSTLVCAKAWPEGAREWVAELDARSHMGALVFSAALATKGLEWWERHHGRNIDPRHSPLLRKALRQALAALAPGGHWPNFNLVIAADAAVNMASQRGPADPVSCGAGWTVVTLLRAHQESDVAERTFCAASERKERMLSLPFLEEREAVVLGRDAVRRYAIDEELPRLPAPS